MRVYVVLAIFVIVNYGNESQAIPGRKITPVAPHASISLPAGIRASNEETLLPSLPEGSKEYKPETWTQAISTNNDRPLIRYVKIVDLDFDWNHSGGLNSTMKFTSRKFKSGGKPKYSVQKIPVLNSFGYYQNELGLSRTYPDGARFDDILINEDGLVFEHRVREKRDGKWLNKTALSRKELRPKGYIGLTQSCSSCHDQAGTGGYGKGLVPGGDTVLSDPMDWDVLTR